MDEETIERGEANQGASSVEVYGFVGWVTTLVGYILYLLWAFLPNAILESIGIAYYPDKHWALTVPTLLCLAIVYVFTGYEFLNMAIVQYPQDQSTIEDNTPQWTETEVDAMMENNTDSIPPLKDIPSWYMSKRLYGQQDVSEMEQEIS